VGINEAQASMRRTIANSFCSDLHGAAPHERALLLAFPSIRISYAILSTTRMSTDAEDGPPAPDDQQACAIPRIKISSWFDG
jgi:hypothetical protein